jgi:hypothetical protein
MSSTDMTTYDHTFSLLFSVESEDKHGSDVTANQLREAIKIWLDTASDWDILNNCDTPCYTEETV